MATKSIDLIEEAGCLTALGLIILIGFGLHIVFGGSEREGRVKIDSCLEEVYLNTDSIQSYYKDFTCVIEKTKTGKIISGKCIHIDMSGSTCKTAFIYDKSPSNICRDPKFPHLHYDDLCWPGY